MSAHNSSHDSDLIVEQRVRNRIIELLEIVVSEDICSSLGVDEVVNLWYDFVPDGAHEMFLAPTYTEEEREAVSAVCDAFEQVVFSTPNPMPDFGLLKIDPVWIKLVDACQVALAKFRIRGRLSEN